MTIKVTKQLATKQDLALGSGQVVQERNGISLTLDEINVSFNSSSIAEIKASTASVGSVFNLSSEYKSGTFDVIAGNFSTKLAADLYNGIYIGLSDDPTGVTKVAKRRHNGDVNANWFGATGDGATNDSPFFQAALNSLDDGDSLHVPAPDASYRLGTSLNINKRIGIVGYGSLFTVATAIPCFNMDAIGCSISGILISGNRTPGQFGIRISRDNVKVRDVEISLVDVGFEVWGGVWQRIEHIRMSNIRARVMTVGNVVGTVVEDLRYDTDTANYAQPNVGIELFGEGCNFSDLDLIHAGTCLDISTFSGTRSSTWNFFNSCSFDSSTHGLRVRNTSSGGESVLGMMFDHCWFSSHSEQGILLDGQFNTDGISFKGCTIVNNKKGGLFTAEVTNNVEITSCTFGSNSIELPGTYPHIKLSSIGRTSILNSQFTDWGGQSSTHSAAIERTATGGYVIIDGCYALTSKTGAGLIDNSSNDISLGVNFDNLPSDAAATGSFVPESTVQSSGNINLTSSASSGTVKAASVNNSAFVGITSSAANYGGVFSNSAGGAGLRVNQGTAQFADSVSMDTNLRVEGNIEVLGTVTGPGFSSSASGAYIPDDTVQSSGNINLTSSATVATVKARSTTNSGVVGETTSAANYGGVFSNSAGGAGLRVNQGTAQFAGAATFDSAVTVIGVCNLSGNVTGTGFNSAVDNRVTYETLNAKSDVGTGSNQVARGNHSHVKNDILQFQDFRMFGTSITTNGSGQAVISHTLGVSPSIAICGTFGGASNKVDAVAVSSSSITVEVRDIATGNLNTNASILVYTIVAVPPPV